MSNIGIILSAGKQNRFNGNGYKALMPYNNEKTVLDINIETMLKFVDSIFLVLNEDNDNHPFEDVLKRYAYSVWPLLINSGLGCGDAVLTTLDLIEKSDDDNVFLLQLQHLILMPDSYPLPSRE